MLEYKCQWYGRTLVKVDRFFPSSKLCCICHEKNAELQLQDRWRCPHCKTEHQRDENAIVNIFRSEEHTSELQSHSDLVCRLLLDTATTEIYTLSLHDALPIYVGIQMPVVRKDAGQSRQVLSVVKVVLHLPREECRTPTPRPLAVPPLQNRTSAGRKCHRKHFQIGRAHV